MARKRRKIAKQPESSPVPAAQQPAWLPWLGGLALVFAWLATLGGTADETMDLRRIFTMDNARPHLMFLDLFSPGGGAPSDWIVGAAPYYFPDLLMQWAAMAAGMDWRAAMWAQSLAQVALAAQGWTLTCDALYGKDPARRAAVWLLHALAFLSMAWNGTDILGIHMMPMWHYGAWAAIPWLLWLSLAALKDDSPPAKKRRALAGMLALLILIAASDVVIFPWFVAAAAGAALLTTPRDSANLRTLGAYLAALAAGMVAGPALAEIPGFVFIRSAEVQFSVNPENIAQSVGAMADILGAMAAKHPAEGLAWTAFAAIALWRLAVVFPRLDIWRRGKEKPQTSGVLRSLFGVPPGRAHRFVAVFVPASAALSAAAVVVIGNIHPFPWVFPHYDRVTRHFLPLIYFPLFAGWALLPWRFGTKRLSAAAAVAGGFALVVLSAAPKMLFIDWEKTDPLATPFHRCYEENAKRLGWKAGIAPYDFSLVMESNPMSGVERVSGVAVEQRGDRPVLNPKNGALTMEWGGEYQFVVINLSGGRVFGRPPRAHDSGCPPKYPDILNCQQSTPAILDAATARTVFGEPSEIIDCAGVGFFHYDQPLRFNPPEKFEDLDAFYNWPVIPLK